MEIINFDEIPIMEIGNDYTVTGINYTNKEGKSILIVLPQESVDENKISIMYPSLKEWYDILRQSDICEVEGISEGQKTILRKGQRIIDSKISFKVFKRDKFKCRYCGIDFVPLTVDHIITWETGGATHEDNLLTSCKKCNKKRGNLDYKSWLNSTYYKSKLQYLDDITIKKNDEIVSKLHLLPVVLNIRNR